MRRQCQSSTMNVRSLMMNGEWKKKTHAIRIGEDERWTQDSTSRLEVQGESWTTSTRLIWRVSGIEWKKIIKITMEIPVPTAHISLHDQQSPHFIFDHAIAILSQTIKQQQSSSCSQAHQMASSGAMKWISFPHPMRLLIDQLSSTDKSFTDRPHFVIITSFFLLPIDT